MGIVLQFITIFALLIRPPLKGDDKSINNQLGISMGFSLIGERIDSLPKIPTVN